MVSMRDFLSGIVGGILHTFITPYILEFIPSFGQWILASIYNIIFFGVWIVVATLILEKTGH